jgi:hypothetical protein
MQRADVSKSRVIHIRGWWAVLTWVIIILAAIGIYYLYNSRLDNFYSSTNCPIYNFHSRGSKSASSSYFYLPEGTIYGQASTNGVYFTPDRLYRIANFNEEIKANAVRATTCFNSIAEAENARYTFAG